MRIDKDSTLGLLTKLTALGSVLRQTGPLKPSWFEDEKRTELQQVAIKCQRQIDEANRLRNVLSERMNSAAFDLEGESIAAAASEFDSLGPRIWNCITGNWGRFVRKSATLYLQPSSNCPGTMLGDILRDVFTSRPGASSKSPRRLLEDMSRLRAYHALIRSVRTEESIHAAHLICDEQGRPRWPDFASGIDAISRLRTIIAIPDRLKQVLTTEGMIDRDALDVATQDLDHRLRDLDSRVNSLDQRLAISGMGTGKTSYADVSPMILQNWLQDMESSVRQRVSKLKSVAATFETDRDVALSDLPSCIARVEEICCLQGRQNDLRSALDGVLDRTLQIDAIALVPFTETARNVVRFLDTYGDSPHESLLDVVTRSEARLSLGNACSTLASLLDELEVRLSSLGQRLALTSTETGETSYADVSSTVFQDWLQETESAVRQRVTTLKAVAAGLVAERDFALSDLPSGLARLEELRRLKDRRTDLCSALDGVVDQNASSDATVLAPLVETARHVARFLDTYGDSPRGSLLEVVTRSEARLSLGNACSTLDSLFAELEGRVRSLGQQPAPTGIRTDTSSYADVFPTVLQDWLQEMESAVRQRVTRLKLVAAMLEANRDVALSDLSSCLARLEEIRCLQGRQNGLRSELEGIVDPSSPIDMIALTPFVETSRHVARFLDTYGDSPRESLLDVVTRNEARLSLGTACSTLTSLLDESIEQAWATLWKCFPRDEPSSAALGIDGMPLARLGAWLDGQVRVVDRLLEWIRFREVEEALNKLKVLPVLHEVLSREIAIEEAGESYLARFYRVWLDAAYSSDAMLREFRVDEHEDLIAAFRNLDREAIGGAFKRIRTKLLMDASRPHSGMLTAPSSSELGILLREVGKRKRHMALRQLFRRIPTLLPRLKPCVMMSPLAVSTYLDSADLKFDLVIFDEASQVRPFDAIGAVYRGSQIIVAGDQKQLPPTSFFDRLVSDDDSEISDDEEEDTVGRLSDFESVLDVCCSMGMPRKSLRWHYRSRREPLIAFSNRHFYANELATFPSVLRRRWRDGCAVSIRAGRSLASRQRRRL